MSGLKASRTDDTDSFFRAFKADTGAAADAYTPVALGDSPEMADDLLKLVLAGVKRATTRLARDFGPAEPLPTVGDYVVVVDGRNKPRCVWRATHIAVKPLSAVDDDFAREEGEGERTRTAWLADHTACFQRQAAREGFAFHDDIETVFERFTVVWPRLFAD